MSSAYDEDQDAYSMSPVGIVLTPQNAVIAAAAVSGAMDLAGHTVLGSFTGEGGMFY